MVSKQHILILLLIIGIIISAYLVSEHYLSNILACPENSLINCSVVLASQYSTILGVPLAVLSAVWVVVMLALALTRKSKITTHILPIWGILGIVGVSYSLISQYLVGKACIYCLGLDAIILITVILMQVPG